MFARYSYGTATRTEGIDNAASKVATVQVLCTTLQVCTKLYHRPCRLPAMVAIRRQYFPTGYSVSVATSAVPRRDHTVSSVKGHGHAIPWSVCDKRIGILLVENQTLVAHSEDSTDTHGLLGSSTIRCTMHLHGCLPAFPIRNDLVAFHYMPAGHGRSLVGPMGQSAEEYHSCVMTSRSLSSAADTIKRRHSGRQHENEAKTR